MRLEHPYYIVDRGLSHEVCQRIIEAGESAEAMAAQAIRDPQNTVRNSTVSWLGSETGTAWLFNALGTIVREANERLWHWTLSGPESMQYTRYGPEQYYNLACRSAAPALPPPTTSAGLV